MIGAGEVDAATIANPACAGECSPLASAQTLNRECFCIGLDLPALQQELAGVLGRDGLPGLAESHPHLFSTLPVFVSRRHLEQTAVVVQAIEKIVAMPGYVAAALHTAPTISAFEPGSPGGILGFDFHLEADGPKLIEINTNPGGVLLNALLGRAQRACVPELVLAPPGAGEIERQVISSFLNEWSLQRGDEPLRTLAIVDEAPEQQYLYPEFQLFRALFRAHGIEAEICDPRQLVHSNGGLWLGERKIDLCYNRLTDFSLDGPASAALRAAYLAREVVVTPHPRAHALYADKRNLIALGERTFLESIGVEPNIIDSLGAAIPPTLLLTAENRDALWARRRQLFFKPASGFGSKASYRGDKLTQRVWKELAGGTYVAQQIVAPGSRHIEATAEPLKFDLRAYAYQGRILLYAARVYQGQTTNFRTPGGGFSPVLTHALMGA